MKSNITDYLPKQGEEHNGQQHERKFGIVPAKDKDTETILQARKECITDPELTDGARNLFTLLLDLALDPDWNMRRRGQVALSNTKLRELLSRSARAIYGWTQELKTQRHIWVSKLGRPNTQPMNVYHITALQPRRELGVEVANDGAWGNGYRRPAQPMPAGARATGKKRHYLFDQFGKPVIVQVAQNEPATRKFCGSHPQVLREGPAQNDTCHPQVLRETSAESAGVSRTEGHLPPAKNDTTPEQKPAVFKGARDVSPRPLESLYNVQRGNRFKKGGENEFLAHVAEVMARHSKDYAVQEMGQSGAWWRLQYRKDKDKACRVLADLESAIKEGVNFSVNPGAFAADLFKRFA